MNISETLHLSNLTDEERRVMKLLYEHQRQVDASQNWRLYQRVDGMVEEPLSPGRVIEQALQRRGLSCRSPRGREYAYAISFDGYEWYQREVDWRSTAEIQRQEV